MGVVTTRRELLDRVCRMSFFLYRWFEDEGEASIEEVEEWAIKTYGDRRNAINAARECLRELEELGGIYTKADPLYFYVNRLT